MSHRDAVQKAIDALFERGEDNNVDVRDQALQALRAFATKDLATVLSRGCEWLTMNKPPSRSAGHRLFVCKTIGEILRAQDASAAFVQDQPLLDRLVRASIADMTAVVDINSEWSQEACALCVQLCGYSPAACLTILLDQAQSGVVPHLMILRALADFADGSPMRFSAALRDTLAKLLPMLSGMRQDNPRMFTGRLLGCCAEVSLDVLSLQDDTVARDALTPRSAAARNIKPSELAESMNAALQTLLNEWSKSSELRVRGPVTFAIGALCGASSDDARATNFSKVVAFVMQAVKKERPRDVELPARGAAALCRHVGPVLLSAVQPHIDAMFQCAVAAVSAIVVPNNVDAGNAAAVAEVKALRMGKEHLLNWTRELMRIDPTGALSAITKLLDAKSGSRDPAVRASAITVIEHALGDDEVAIKLAAQVDSVIAVAKLVSGDVDLRVRRAYAGVGLAMLLSPAAKIFFAAIGAHAVLAVAIKSCAISDAAVEEFSTRKDQSGLNPASFRDHSRTCLLRATQGTDAVLATRQEQIDDVLWPFLLEHIAQYPSEPDLVHAFPFMCQALVPLAARKGETDTFYIDFRVNVNVPKPAFLAAVLLCELFVSGLPIATSMGRSLQRVADTMCAVAPLLDEPFMYQHLEELPTPVASLWLGSIPELNELQKKNDPGAWEDVVCRLAGRTATARSEPEWNELMASGCFQLVGVYRGLPHLQRAALTLGGIVLSRVPKKEFVAGLLDGFISAVDHGSSPLVRDGLGRGLAYASANKEYSDLVLERLSAMSKPPEKKSGGGLFSFGSKAKETGTQFTEYSRAVAGIAACAAVKRLPTAVLVSRAETAIMPVLTSVLETPEPVARLEIIGAIPSIKGPLRKASVGTGFQLKGRDAVVDILARVAGIALGSTASYPRPLPSKDAPALHHAVNVFVQTVDAITAMIESASLPALSPETLKAAVGVVAECFVAFRHLSSLPEGTVTQLRASVDALAAAIIDHLAAQGAVDITSIVTTLQPQLQSPEQSARFNAGIVLHQCVASVVRNVNAESEKPITCIAPTGALCAMVAARWNDSDAQVRDVVLDTTAELLQLLLVLHPDANISADDVMAKLRAVVAGRPGAATPSGIAVLDERLRESRDRQFASYNKELCGVLVACVATPSLFTPCVAALTESGVRENFADVLALGESAAVTCAVCLHGMIRGFGGTLSEAEVRTTMDSMLESARVITAAMPALPPSSNAIIAAVAIAGRNLAKHHPVPFCTHLLVAAPATPPPCALAFVHGVAADTSFASTLTRHCLDTLLNSQTTEERMPANVKNAKPSPMVASNPLAAACVLGNLSIPTKAREVLLQHQCAAFAAMSLFLSNVFASGAGDSAAAAAIVATSIQRVVELTASNTTKRRMQRYGWGNLVNPDRAVGTLSELIKYIAYDEAYGDENVDNDDRELPFAFVPGDSSIVSNNNGNGGGLALPCTPPTQFVIDLAEFILPYASKPHPSPRRVAINFLGTILRHACDEESLLTAVLTALLGRTGADETTENRIDVLRSFDVLLSHSYASIQAFLPTVISTLMAALDDREMALALVAFGVMDRLFAGIEDATAVRPMVVTILMRVRTKFDSNQERLRIAAFGLLDRLIQMAEAGALDGAAMEMQFVQTIVSLLLHCEDSSDEAAVVARRALLSGMRLLTTRPGAPDGLRKDVKHLCNSGAVADGAPPRDTERTVLVPWAAVWVTHFPGRIKETLGQLAAALGSDSVRFRLAATATMGQLLKRIAVDDLSRTGAFAAIQAITTSLAKDNAPEMRQKCASALALIPY